MNFGVGILKMKVWIWNQHPWDTMCTKFEAKRIGLSEFQKSKSRFGISILEILDAAIFRQKQQFWTFGLKFDLKWILGLELQKS